MAALSEQLTLLTVVSIRRDPPRVLVWALARRLVGINCSVFSPLKCPRAPFPVLIKNIRCLVLVVLRTVPLRVSVVAMFRRGILRKLMTSILRLRTVARLRETVCVMLKTTGLLRRKSRTWFPV